MVGETLREIGVLVFVFAPLESMSAPERLTAAGMAGIVVAAVLMIVVGMLVALEK